MFTFLLIFILDQWDCCWNNHSFIFIFIISLLALIILSKYAILDVFIHLLDGWFTITNFQCFLCIIQFAVTFFLIMFAIIWFFLFYFNCCMVYPHDHYSIEKKTSINQLILLLIWFFKVLLPFFLYFNAIKWAFTAFLHYSSRVTSLF
jgi:hypothetical protein